jgi:tetratricopeptide (TPR) repeat protein/predicted Ser/Thr protein kinase
MNEGGMNLPVKCPQCGAFLPAGELEGLCPACLLKQGTTAETATDPEASSFQPPDVDEVARMFPQLEILAFIGKGGMGAVYKARQPALDRIVALKILPPQAPGRPGFAERFNREARALAKLNHPNIVTVHEFGQVNGLPFFIMEFVDGLNLRQLERSGRLSPREALQIVPQICEALQFAHDEGIVHRDIKPENILLDKKGRVKIADFGIAKIVGGEGRAGSPLPAAGAHGVTRPTEGLTETGKIIGTPRYMAPEQVEDPQSVDHRADIYSLGVVFYEMLTGELPLGKFGPPSRKVDVDVRLDEVVLRALEKEPERRYQQASQVRTAVETIALAGPAAAPDRSQLRPGPWVAEGFEYRSRATWFGLPLVHVAIGIDPLTGRKRIARGILAIGDIAQGVVAIGGVAIGGVTFGGVSIGVLAYGGCALGLVAFGGLGIALMAALGGLAIAPIALGGGAFGYLAYGGAAYGVHPLGSNAADDMARNFFGSWATDALAASVPVSTALVVSAIVLGVGLPQWLRYRAMRKTSQSRNGSWMIAAGSIAVLILLLVTMVLIAGRLNRVKSDYIGQTYFPKGDSIEITAVKRTSERMVVKGHYNLVSQDQASLALYITTSTNIPVPEDPQQQMQISKGRGDFELIHAHLAPGLPHISMYADGKSFAALYFGTRAEAFEESKAGWIAETNQTASQLAQEGWRLWQARKPGEATTKFEQAVRLDPNNANDWNGLGWATFNSGKIEDAERAFQKVISLEPNHPAALNGLGQIYLLQRKYGEAEEYLLKAAPQAPAAWYGLARLYLLQGNFEQAERWAQNTVDSGQADEVVKRMLQAAKEKRLNEGLRLMIEPPFSPHSDTNATEKLRYKQVQTANSSAEIDGQTLAEQPPVVVETIPVSGTCDVAWGETEIRVRFSKEMTEGSWSWSTAWQDSTPESVGPPHYLADHRTCVMKVKLEAGKTYAWWLNSEKFRNFTDSAGHPAIPYLLILQTKPK